MEMDFRFESVNGLAKALGGKSVWYPKSQLGCAFVGTDKIISSRE